MSVALHIVSFDIPYPPDYGGVIDVYFKIRALRNAGAKIILHCFHYGRNKAAELESLCQEVNYYPRLTGWRKLLTMKPYIVSTRVSASLRRRLLQDDLPILFEGLHTCGLLSDPALKGRVKIYRESNIEHRYYFHLFMGARGLIDRIYFLTESLKLRLFQPVLEHADLMLVVSRQDQAYLQKRFPGKNVHYLPSFHREMDVSSLPGRGSYVLYQGNLSVTENIRAVRTIVRDIYDASLPELVIAGKDPPFELAGLIGRKKNIRLIQNPDEEQMTELIGNAQINLMVTSQPTGLKLKLINALFHGRHCLVNPEMLAGSGLDPLCHVAVTPREFRETIGKLFTEPFTSDEIDRRKKLMAENYSNEKNCNILLDLVTLFSA